MDALKQFVDTANARADAKTFKAGAKAMAVDFDRRRDHLLGVIRAIELNVDGLITKGYQQKKETQAALDRIKSLCREALK